MSDFRGYFSDPKVHSNVSYIPLTSRLPERSEAQLSLKFSLVIWHILYLLRVVPPDNFCITVLTSISVLSKTPGWISKHYSDLSEPKTHIYSSNQITEKGLAANHVLGDFRGHIIHLESGSANHESRTTKYKIQTNTNLKSLRRPAESEHTRVISWVVRREVVTEDA